MKNLYGLNLDIEFMTPTQYNLTFWSGSINETRLRLDSIRDDAKMNSLQFFSALAMNKARNKVYCCAKEENFQVESTCHKLIILLIHVYLL